MSVFLKNTFFLVTKLCDSKCVIKYSLMIIKPKTCPEQSEKPQKKNNKNINTMLSLI